MALPENALCTVTEVRTYLNLPSTDPTDTVLEALITYASDVIEDYVGTNIISDEHSEYYDGDGSTILVPRHYPITSVTTFQIDDEDVGTEGEDYYVYDSYIVTENAISKGNKNVYLVYTSGWGSDAASIPMAFKLACLKLVGYWYRRDVAAYSDTFGEPEDIRRLPAWPLPAAVKDLLNAYRIIRH